MSKTENLFSEETYNKRLATKIKRECLNETVKENVFILILQNVKKYFFSISIVL